MSKNLQHFVNNFVLGMQLGSHFMDKRDQAEYRRQQIEVAREKMKLEAQRHAEKMGLETRRVGAIEKDVEGRYIKNTRAPAGKAGPAGPTAAQLDFHNKYPGTGGTGFDEDVTQGPTIVVQPGEQPDAPLDTGTSLVEAKGGRIPEMARGGRAMMGALQTGMMAGRMVNRVRGRDQWGRPINPDPREAPGTSGPGSGYGAIATRPPTALNLPQPEPDLTGTYQHGGKVQRMQSGGVPEMPYPNPYVDPAIPPPPVPMYRGAYTTDQYGRPVPAPPLGEPREFGPQMPADASDWDVITDKTSRNWEAVRRAGEAVRRFGEPRGDQPPPRVQQPSGPPANPNIRPMSDLDNLKPTDPINQTVEQAPASDYVAPGPPPGSQGDAVPPGVPTSDSPDQYYNEDPSYPRKKEDVPPPSAVQAGARPSGGGGGGRGQGAIQTGWKPLRDRTRTEAFDPTKDRFDPDNVHAVDNTGAALAGATAYAQRVFGQGNTQGKIQGQQTGGEGAGMDPRADRGKHALYSGVGSADPKLMEQIFQKVDPENKLSMDQKMLASVKQVYKFYADQGDMENANKSAFEVAQFANQMAKQAGAEAIKRYQAGDKQGALDIAIRGYNFLPDGNNASLQGDRIVITSETGQPVAAYPLDDRSMQNIMLGMASGQLGMDVIRIGGKTMAGGEGGPSGGPPGGAIAATPPPAMAAAPPVPIRGPQAPAGAAQPAAAPAGPPAQAPAATAPAGSAAPARPPSAAPPPAGTPRAPGSTPPVSPPAAAPASPQRTAAPSAGGTTPAQGDNVPATGPAKGVDNKPPGAKVEVKSPEEQEQEFRTKNPFGAPPGVTRERSEGPDRETPAAVSTAVAKGQQKLEAITRQIQLDGMKAGVKQSQIDKKIAYQNKLFDDWKKGLNEQLKEHRAEEKARDREERASIKPREIPMGQESQAADAMATKITNLTKEAQRDWGSAGVEKEAGDRAKSAHAASPLRYLADPKDFETLNRVATSIWTNNGPKHSLDNSVSDAVYLTSIVRPTPAKADPVGMNLNKGEKATTFKRLPNDLNGNVLLQLPSGRKVRMDKDTYTDLMSLHKQNWDQYAQEKKDMETSKGKQDAARKAIQTLTPGDLTPSLMLP